MMDLDPVELRVLGCLIEKQRTTPDQYPLSLNGLRLACNQTTNRDPVVEYDETTIREALHRLSQRRYTRLASGHTSRAYKFRHLLDEALALEPGPLAVLAVLMLRGAQTPGELKQRTDRMQGFPGLEAVHDVLDELIEREYVARIERRPGQKEERYRHRLSDEAAGAPPPPAPAAPAPPSPASAATAAPASAATAAPASAATAAPASAATAAPTPPPAPAPAPAAPADEERLDRLEAELAELREEVARLRDALGG